MRGQRSALWTVILVLCLLLQISSAQTDTPAPETANESNDATVINQAAPVDTPPADPSVTPQSIADTISTTPTDQTATPESDPATEILESGIATDSTVPTDNTATPEAVPTADSTAPTVAPGTDITIAPSDVATSEPAPIATDSTIPVDISGIGGATATPGSVSTDNSVLTDPAAAPVATDSATPVDATGTADPTTTTDDSVPTGSTTTESVSPTNGATAANDPATPQPVVPLDGTLVGRDSLDVNATDLNGTATVPDPQYDTNEGTSNNTTFPQSVILGMADRVMRYHHYLWHQVRDGWLRFTPEVQQRYTEIGWAPPRPSRNYTEDGKIVPLYDNDSGEDFLFMHRHMIQEANRMIAENNETYGNITGWKTIPAPGDPEYPVPPPYEIPNDPAQTNSTTNRKTDEFYNTTILSSVRTFTNPDRLRNMTLGQLGSRIEMTIHGYLHMRFSSNSTYGFRPGYINRTNLPYMDPKWDNPEYNWLGDSYASQVHPLFWKIHGWVDDRIEDWRIANNITEIEWKGTWIGGPMSNITNLTDISGLKTKMAFRGAAPTVASMAAMDMGASNDGNMNIMEDAMSVWMNSGCPESTFWDEVEWPDFGDD